ncbi:MAG: carbohydrate-binding family 9-like protein [Deltaproteobacteria bacterium]|nr:carbohydrate-binding family 9-like protein [Deltaproteobacteria bacterium]
MRKSMIVLAALAALASCKDESAPNPGRGGGEATSHVSTSAPASVQQPIHVTFQGGAIELIGTDLSPAQPKAGQTVTVTNYYKVNRAPEGSWKLFVHVAAPGQGGLQMIANRDHEPMDGQLPLSQWKPGQVIADAWQLPIPQQAPPQIAVLLGFWNDSGRMPVDPQPPGEQPKTDGQGRVLAAVIPVTVAGPPLPTYVVPKRQGEITIDGKLDDAAWQKAPSTPAFVNTMNGGQARSETHAKLLWDDQFLYVAFDVQTPDVWGTKTQKDEPIYGEQVVEIFIDADGDQKTYNELEVSPHNIQFDAAFDYRRSDLQKAMAWDSKMESAVQVQGTLDNSSDTDRGFTVEMKIPIANLYAVPHVPPQVGDTWRFNLYYIDNKKNDAEGFSPPMVGDFHNLVRFGYLKFAE